MLRPVGTEIEIAFPPDPASSRSVFTLWRYRISAHSATDRGPLETLTPLSSREFPVTSVVIWMGRWTAVPPEECLPYLGAGWRAVFDHASA